MQRGRPRGKRLEPEKVLELTRIQDLCLFTFDELAMLIGINRMQIFNAMHRDRSNISRDVYNRITEWLSMKTNRSRLVRWHEQHTNI